MWLMGGYGFNEVWFTEDGISWINTNASGHWSPREMHASTVYNNRIWVMGGDGLNDVWSYGE